MDGYFLPPAFARHPMAKTDPIWITLEEHTEVVKWWNELNRRRNGINILDWSDDDEWGVTVAAYNLIIINRAEEHGLYYGRAMAHFNLKQFDNAIIYGDHSAASKNQVKALSCRLPLWRVA
jgi:hypothetical protein